MKLYLLQTKGLGRYWVIANSSDAAISNLESALNKADYGFTKDRKVEQVTILTDEITLDHRDKPYFSDSYRLLLPEIKKP